MSCLIREINSEFDEENVDVGDKNESVQEKLEWELSSLDSRDIQAHAWYHGPLSRTEAENYLSCDGDFLVRDCSSSHERDFVLSCRWKCENLHFLVYKKILQKDTIYEQIRYLFEVESFDTVQDLVRYHVGSSIPISRGSGAIITNPKNRTAPLYKSSGPGYEKCKEYLDESTSGDYASLSRFEPISVYLSYEMISILERSKTLKLKPPIDGLLEELSNIPGELEFMKERSVIKESSFDLTEFESMLMPISSSRSSRTSRLNSDTIKMVNTQILETSSRIIALHMTKADWNVFTLSSENENLGNDLYELFFHNSQHRWNNIIERSISQSQFICLTILLSDKREEMIDKWITIASELRVSFGNFYSFGCIMRGLLMPQITGDSVKVNWSRLRREFTESTFAFETTLRSFYQGYVKGTETYPPNTTIPDIFIGALILEDSIHLLPSTCINIEDHLEFYAEHLSQLRSLKTFSSIHKRNFERQSEDIEYYSLLLGIFKTEFHLTLLWGNEEYCSKSLQERIQEFDKLV